MPGGGDWYAEVAPAEHQALYEAVRTAASRSEGVTPVPGMPCAATARRSSDSRSPAAVALPGLGAGDVLPDATAPGPGRRRSSRGGGRTGRRSPPSCGTSRHAPWT